jgi:predicted ATPase
MTSLLDHPETLGAVTATVINTPDRRVRVFISSTLGELATERQAAGAAVSALRLTPVMFETGARPHPPRELYRAYLAQSDVFVGIYWERYGWVAPEEPVSGLEDEYLLSGNRPKLIYVKRSHQREPRLAELLQRIQTDDRVSYKHFDTAAELTSLLADDLALLLTERFTLGGAPSTGLRTPQLPVPPTAIVGRSAETGALVALLAEPEVRLVTVYGPGGVGKTRLALEVAAVVAATQSADLEGVWFVDLSSAREPAQLTEAVAVALGIRQEGTSPLSEVVADVLRTRRLLLVLDNFEQVMPAAVEVAALLAACPGLTVLVTSRSVLQLRGEREVSLEPLPTPVAGGADVATIGRSAAVQLFVLRGRQVRPDLSLTADNCEAVAELCRMLDGVPLALELAAAQLRLLSPEQLLRRLTDRFERLLDLNSGAVDLPSRQQTLRTTVEWSYSLLTPAEQALFGRLSIFVGTWTLEAADAVGGANESADVLGTLSSLVTQSLIVPDSRGRDQPRFRMLATVRAVAQEHSEQQGTQSDAEHRLRQYLLRFVGEAGRRLARPNNHHWMLKVDAELPDLKNMVAKAVDDDDAETVIRATAPLFSYWWSHGELETMRELAERAVHLPSAAALSTPSRALMLWAQGMFQISTGHNAEALPILRELLETATMLADERLRAHALAGLGLAAAADDPDAARTLLQQAIGAFRSQQDSWGLAFVLSSAGQIAVLTGDFQTATVLHREALGLALDIENAHLQAQLLDQLGLDAFAGGDIAEARARFVESAALHIRLLDQEGSAYCLDGMAAIALAQGNPAVAARLLAAASHARSVVGVAIWPAMRALNDALRGAVIEAAEPSEFTRETTSGAGMGTMAALVYGLAQTAPAPGAAA